MTEGARVVAKSRGARFLSLVAILGTMTASIGIALLLAEIAVRVAAPQQLIAIRPDLWQPVDSVGWLHRPGVDVRMNTGEREVAVRTDADGFRVGTAGRRDADTRVLLMGDSFVEALALEHEQTVAHLLEDQLSKSLDRSVVVRNAGVGGWDPNQYLLRTRQIVGRDQFKLVIVTVFVGNDVLRRRVPYLPPRQPAERMPFRVPSRLNGAELRAAVLSPLNNALEVRSHLFVLLKNELSNLRAQLGLTAAYFPDVYRRELATSPRWSMTAEVAAELAASAAAHRARTLFVLVPFGFQVNERAFYDYVRRFGFDSSAMDIDQPNRLLATEFAKHGLDVVDALPALREAAQRGQRVYGTVDDHLSAEGHRVLTTVLVPHAIRLMKPTTHTAKARSTWSSKN